MLPIKYWFGTRADWFSPLGPPKWTDYGIKVSQYIDSSLFISTYELKLFIMYGHDTITQVLTKMGKTIFISGHTI